MDNIKVVAIDLAKTVFQICAGTQRGKVLMNKRVTQQQLMGVIHQLPKACTIVMEAGRMSHYWGRKFTQLGYIVKLIAPQFVKPFVKGNKNDKNDALAIYEAFFRPYQHFVPVKTLEQQNSQSLHRARRLVQKQWRALGNQIRGLLAEYGITLPQGACYVRTQVMPYLSEADNGLTSAIREIIGELHESYCQLEQLIKNYEKRIKQLAQNQEDCQRLMKLPGVGPLIATALVAAVGRGSLFNTGREMSAWLGLVPKQRASGTKSVMQGISKRGDSYLRSLIIHGARSIVSVCDKKTDKRNRWVLDKKLRLGTPKATVALANKMSREMWAVLHKGDAFVF